MIKVTASHISNMQPIPTAAYLQVKRSHLGMQTTTEAVQLIAYMTILTHVTARIFPIPHAHHRATAQPGVGTKESPFTVFLTLSTYGPAQFMLTHLTNPFWPCNGLCFVSTLLPLKTPTIINLQNGRIITYARKISKNLTGLCASTNR